MSKWRRTFKIKDLLSGDTTADGIKTCADGIIDRLPTEAYTRGITKARDMADADPETALLVFNDGLDRLYDWADEFESKERTDVRDESDER